MSLDDPRPGAPSPTPTPKPGIWSRYKGRLLAAIPVIVIGIGIVVYRYVATQNGISGAEVGSCASVEGTGNDTTYTRLDCSDPKATLTVLAQLPNNDSSDCRTVAGSTQSTVAGKYAKVTCLGDKGVDPATSTNTAAVGECLDEKGDFRKPCSDPAAAFTIVQRLDKVAKENVEASCTDEKASNFFATGWSQSGGVATFGSGETVDYTVFCVAPIQR